MTAETTDRTDSILDVSGLNKSFWSVPVLTDVDFAVRRGEVHALVGENGAGKSTLTKIICGAYVRDSGRMAFDGAEYSPASPAEALLRGIAVIHQETSLVPSLTIRENVFLGIESAGAFGMCGGAEEKRRFDSLCERIGYRLPAGAKAGRVGPAERKLAEIAKALAHDARLLIMDEPTDSLSGGEMEAFFSVVEDLKRRGITIIYITHYLGELFRIADRVTVLKDGRRIDTLDTAATTGDAIVNLMLGRSGDGRGGGRAESRRAGAGAELLRAENLSRAGHVNGVSLALRENEVTGLVGVIGSGKTELARLLFGADRPDGGGVFVRGGRVDPLTPRSAKAAGIGFLPEDRKTQGLLQEQSVQRNLTLAALEKVSDGQVISAEKERNACRETIASLSVKTAGPGQRVKFLSGGNQQKVILGKWLLADPDILILDEPTRGIDVGSKQAIYELVGKIAEQGKSVLFISSEVGEALAVSDRILVMRKGRIAGEFPRGAAEEEVLARMLEAEKA